MNPEAILISSFHHSAWLFFCPGCKLVHSMDPLVWHFNNDSLRPSFTPAAKFMRCQLEVRDGFLIYHSSTSHHLSGQTVPMVPYKDWSK